MNFQGQELISRATYVSNRSLMALALAKILTVYSGVCLQNLEILGVSPNLLQLTTITNLMIGFLLVNHVLFWLGDFSSFRAWNHPGKTIHKGTIDDEDNTSYSELEYFAFKVKELFQEKSREMETPGAQSHIDVAGSPAELTKRARELMRGVSRLTWHASFYLWVWFLIIPVGTALVALWLQRPDDLQSLGCR